jgi:hypothetical protein
VIGEEFAASADRIGGKGEEQHSGGQERQRLAKGCES